MFPGCPCRDLKRLSLPRPVSGAASALPAAGPHSHGDEGRDHPAAPGPQSRPHGKHEQLPQPVRQATHQRQVRCSVLEPQRGRSPRGRVTWEPAPDNAVPPLSPVTLCT